MLVYDPEDVGIASSVDPADEVSRAEDAAVEAANDTNSFAVRRRRRAAALGSTARADGTAARRDRPATSSDDEGGSSGAGSADRWSAC